MEEQKQRAVSPGSDEGKTPVKKEHKIKTHDHPNFGKGKHRVNPDAVNHEFRRKLWDGQIPLKVSLHYKDISTTREVRSLYIMIPRLNYLTFILDKVKTFFDEYVSPDLLESFGTMWFDYEDTPLRWDVPVGV